MKILFVIDSLAGGGAEKIVTLLSSRFSDMGHDVTVVTISKYNSVYELNKDVKIVNLDIEKRALKFVSIFDLIYRIVSGLKKAISQQQPDVVIGFVTDANIMATLAAKWAKIPVIVSERSAFHRGPRSPMWHKIRRVVYRHANALVALTKEDMPKYDFVKKRVMIQNPLVLQDKHGSVAKEKIILAVGRLHPVKGYDMLIEAYAKIEHKAGWKLQIMGEGSERVKLESLVSDYGLSDSVELLGQVSDIEIYYKKASIFALSSRSEGFPGALCEAMGYGCAVVAFDCLTGPGEIIEHGVDGILVEAENVQKFSEELESLMEDEPRMKLYGKSAMKIRERLDVKAISKKWISFIEEVIKERNVR